jgi:hypothetical protein
MVANEPVNDRFGPRSTPIRTARRRVVGFGLAAMLTIFAIGSDVDGEILVAQGLSDLLRKKTIIFDQKNFHTPCPSCGTIRLDALA